MLREILRGIISILLLGLAGLMLSWGIASPEPAQALGVGALAGAITGSLLTYWLKPG